MSQLGMQMPGAQRTRPASLNVYTGLLLCAVACLAAATFLVYRAATVVGPDEGALGAFKLHPEGRLALPQD